MTDRCPNCGRFVEDDAAGYYDRLHPDDEESEIVVFCDEACSERHRQQQRAAAMGSRGAEALTLDCRTERREVPAQRILEAVRRVVDGWRFGDDDEPLRDHLYYSVAEASLEDVDEAITDFCEDIAEVVVKVLGGEA